MSKSQRRQQTASLAAALTRLGGQFQHISCYETELFISEIDLHITDTGIHYLWKSSMHFPFEKLQELNKQICILK